MVLSGECVLIREDGVWTAELPQFGCATSGRTRSEALRRARELLELEASDLLDENAPAPRVAHVAEVHVLSVEVTEEDSERMRYVTKSEAAERLEVSRPRITALIAADKLDVRTFDGRELVSLESIERFRNSPRVSGRPAAEQK